MSTRAEWQNELAAVLQDTSIRHEFVDYGSVTFGSMRRAQVEEIRQRILQKHEIQKLSTGFDSHAVGHSLGTLALGQTLRRSPSLRIPRLVLFGCILPTTFEWDVLHQRGQVEAALNERSADDPWAKLAFCAIPDSGAAGCYGFATSGGIVFETDYHWTGHSHLEYREHYRKVWAPFLAGAHPDAILAGQCWLAGGGTAANLSWRWRMVRGLARWLGRD